MAHALFFPCRRDKPSLGPLWFFLLQILLLTALSATLTSPISPSQSIKLPFLFLSSPTVCSVVPHPFSKCDFSYSCIWPSVHWPTKTSIEFPSIASSSRPCAKAIIKFPYSCRNAGSKKPVTETQNLNFSLCMAPLALCQMLIHSVSFRQQWNCA